jgi:hypothetical protein
MTTTIYAMKQALKALHPFEKDANGIHQDWADNRRRASLAQEVQPTVGDYRRVAAAASSLREAIAAEEAQWVEPFGWAKSSEIEQSDKFGGSVNLWRKKYDCDTPLFTRPAQPDTEVLAGKLELMTAERDKMQLELGDRTALIKLLQEIAGFSHIYESDRRAVREAADMLAADATAACAGHGSPAELQRHNDYVVGFNEATKRAQQVAVPQDSALLDHLQQSGSTVEILPGGNSGASWSFRIGGLHAAVHHDIRAAIGLAMLAAAPQPPQADDQCYCDKQGIGEPGVSCGDAHEIWAAAQLAPGEGIADGVARVEALLGASRVPMTNAEIMMHGNALGLTNSIGLWEAFELGVKCAERHCGIGVKP